MDEWTEEAEELFFGASVPASLIVPAALADFATVYVAPVAPRLPSVSKKPLLASVRSASFKVVVGAVSPVFSRAVSTCDLLNAWCEL
jgi:hypothetical protein